MEEHRLLEGMTYDIPASGGKRMARMPRKMSVEHMVVDGEEKTVLEMEDAVCFVQVVQVRVDITSTVRMDPTNNKQADRDWKFVCGPTRRDG